MRTPSLPGAVDYEKEIKPLLTTACVQCHGSTLQKGNLRLDTAANAIKGGDAGAAIAPRAAKKSLLIEVLQVGHDDIPQMPYKRAPLAPEQVSLIAQWINEGAKAPANEKPSVWRHWAFVPPVRTQPPVVMDAQARIRNPIDAFVTAMLEKQNIAPSPVADRATLIRRVSLDLTGLPPSMAEVEAFVKDDRPEAYDDLVESLLKSPHYGERWGRWWLDQARYADTNGYSIDAPRSIWPYRDWVVRALNRDMPFDRFTIEQLAGDLLPKPTAEQMIATGFHRNTQINQEGGIDPEQFRIESVFDRVATTGTVWLGLTIGCAQCHDHKFDPISQQEYYQFFAFFNQQENDGHGGTKSATFNVPDVKLDTVALEAEKKVLEKEIAQTLKEQAPEIENWEKHLTKAQKAKFSAPVLKAFAVPAAKRSLTQQRTIYGSMDGADGTFKDRDAQLTSIEQKLAGRLTTLVMKELPAPRETHMLIKGDFTRPSTVVTAGTPAVLSKFNNQTGKGSRLDLARWLVSKDNPLTARVIVNRLWQQYFGKGIVETDNDFGTQGIPPSHPQLLDWLATEFMRQGWSLKAMHRLIVTSDAYRRSSKVRPDLEEKDPNNRLLARQNRLRLDAEVVRDASLTACGLLSEKIGGTPVFPPQPDGVMTVGQVKRTWTPSTGGDRYRRGIYTFYFRATPHPALNVFDEPDSFTTCTRRLRSDTPLQALTLLNDTAFVEFAEALAKIVEQEGLEVAFRRCMSRAPHRNELERLKRLDSFTAARVLLNLDEAITRE